MATIEQKITAQTNTNWWTSPVSSHQTHIVLTNDVFEFLGNQEKQITLQLYKEDFLKAVNSLSSLYHKTEYRLYEKMRHEILNEIDHIKVYEDILDYISRTIAQ